MHAYLIVGSDSEEIGSEINRLAKKMKFEVLEFPFQKISDVRNLGSYTKLSLKRKQAIVLKGVDRSTPEALNAFLKNLEEPQENLHYILTTSSLSRVLPTVVSRCQVIKIQSSILPIDKAGFKARSRKVEEFLRMEIGKKILLVDKIREREQAIEFLRDLILTSHENLHKDESVQGESAEAKNSSRVDKAKYSEILIFVKAANEALTALSQNGNVLLQLTNMLVNLKAI